MLVNQARWVAEKAKMELITKSWPRAASKKLYRAVVSFIERLDVLDILGYLVCPQCTMDEVNALHVSIDAREMVDQAKIDRVELSELIKRLKSQLPKGKSAGLLPKLDLPFDLGCPEQVRPSRCTRRFFCWRRPIHVIAAAVVPRTILTMLKVSPKGILHETPPSDAPLREGLIAADVSPFARRTAFPRLGVALPGWAPAWPCHAL